MRLFGLFFDRNFMFMGIIDGDYCEKVGDAEFAKAPITSGSFKFVKREIGEFMELEAFEKHYARVPYVKKVTLVDVPEAATRLAMLKAGEADIIANVTGTQVEEVSRDPKLTLLAAPGTYAHYITFCDLLFPEPSPLQDLRVRQAIDCAIDREALARDVFFGQAQPIATPIPPWCSGYDPTIEPTPYDPEKAKSLLAEAGYPDGFEIDASCPREASGLVTEAIGDMLSDVGISCKLNLVETFTYWGLHDTKKLRGLGITNWGAAAAYEPGGMVALWKPGELRSYSQFPEFTKLWDKEMATVDIAKRAVVARDIQLFFRDNLPGIGLVGQNACFGVGPRVKEYIPRAGTGFPQDLWTVKLK